MDYLEYLNLIDMHRLSLIGLFLSVSLNNVF